MITIIDNVYVVIAAIFDKKCSLLRLASRVDTTALKSINTLHHENNSAYTEETLAKKYV